MQKFKIDYTVLLIQNLSMIILVFRLQTLQTSAVYSTVNLQT